MSRVADHNSGYSLGEYLIRSSQWEWITLYQAGIHIFTILAKIFMYKSGEGKGTTQGNENTALQNIYIYILRNEIISMVAYVFSRIFFVKIYFGFDNFLCSQWRIVYVTPTRFNSECLMRWARLAMYIGVLVWNDTLSFCIRIFRQISNISRTLIGNKIVCHSDVVGATPVGAAPTASSFST